MPTPEVITDEQHLLALASQTIRHVIVDHLRRKRAWGGGKRGESLPSDVGDNDMALATAVTMPNLTGYTYDASTFTATLMFDNMFPASVIDLKIASASVSNSNGQALDGEFVNGVTTGNSGDGTAGGDFSFRIFILPGDTVDQSTSPNGTRTVNAVDA